MFNFLNKVRNKSEREKKKILINSTILVMIFIVGVWFLLSDLDSGNNKNNNSGLEFVAERLSDSYKEFSGSLGETKSKFRDIINE